MPKLTDSHGDFVITQGVGFYYLTWDLPLVKASDVDGPVQAAKTFSKGILKEVARELNSSKIACWYRCGELASNFI